MPNNATEPTALLDEITRNTAAGPDCAPPAATTPAPNARGIRMIAFYLPQFHPIPENDAWWGKGFTEWTNVTKALPRFKGHYQPRLPADLGFYDLRRPETLRQQAELARRYGIEGFCFHHYWFAGRRLLESPIELLLAHPELDMPFCVNWANENWSRRWDGHDQDILMAQDHSAEDDIAFARSLEPLFRDPRYIRIDGRPLMMLYKPDLLPDAAATVRRWRAHFTEAGLGNPYITTTLVTDPGRFGMDAVAGFPPFWAGWNLPRLNDRLDLLDPAYRGEVIDYELMAARSIALHPETYKMFPGVCPAWDNEARKPGRGTCFTGSTPAKYAAWLGAACDIAQRNDNPDERLVFVNAWNEWAEGAYLEPDRHHGHAYLQATADVLAGKDAPANLVHRGQDQRRTSGLRWAIAKALGRLSRKAEKMAGHLLQP